MGWVDFKSSDVHLGPWNQWVPSSKTPSISSFVWHLQYLPRWEKILLQQPTGHSETHCYERGGYLAGSGIAGGRSRSWRESHLFRTVPAVTPGLLQALSKLPTIAASLWGLTPAPRKSSSGKPTLCFPLCPFSCLYGRTTVQKQGAWIIAGSQPWFIYPMAEKTAAGE